jgi:hypothetical protein
MWTLVLIVFVVSGASTGGVSTAVSYLDFSTEAKCKAAIEAISSADQVSPNRGNHPNISPSATYKVAGYCVER